MKRKHLSFIFLILSSLISCSHTESLGTRDFTFQQQPRLVIWFQIAGLSAEHLPFLKFDNSQQDMSNVVENMSCQGTLWSHNIYDIRPPIMSRFASQLSGSPDMVGTCEDLKQNFLWDYANQIGYKTYILENEEFADSSFERYFQCKDQNLPLTLIKMRKGTPAQDQFHYQEMKSSISKGVIWDKSCNDKSCFSGWQNNFKSLIGRVVQGEQKSFILFQDSRFLKLIKEHKIQEAKELFIEFFNQINWIEKLNLKNVLVMVSGTNSLPVEFPFKGKEWVGYEKKGANIVYHKDSLISPIWAKGSGSENFCGIYGEEDIVKRLFWTPDEGLFSMSRLKKIFN